MLNLLATVRVEVADLSRVTRFVKVVVFVNSAPDSREQHGVANGATDLLVRAFGDRIGRPGALSGWLHCGSGSPWRSRPSSRWPHEQPSWTVWRRSRRRTGVFLGPLRSGPKPLAMRTQAHVPDRARVVPVA